MDVPLAIYDFEARIMLSLCITFQCTRIPVWEKFNFNVAANKCESLLSGFNRFVNLVKSENMR